MSNTRNLAGLLNSSGLVPLPTKVAGVLPDANAPSGSVIQVVQGISTTITAITSATYVDSGLSQTITPSSASSKILVIWSKSIFVSRSASNVGGVGVQLVRDSTAIQNYGDSSTNPFTSLYKVDATSGGLALAGRVAGEYLDSPSTTSAITYKLQIAVGASGTTATAQNGPSPSMITLLEIAG